MQKSNITDAFKKINIINLVTNREPMFRWLVEERMLTKLPICEAKARRDAQAYNLETDKAKL